jgi:hypothetical protein
LKSTKSWLNTTAAIAAVAVVLVATVLLAGCGSRTAGRAAADFSGVTLEGMNVSLSEYRGKPLVLAFMASW